MRRLHDRARYIWFALFGRSDLKVPEGVGVNISLQKDVWITPESEQEDVFICLIFEGCLFNNGAWGASLLKPLLPAKASATSNMQHLLGAKMNLIVSLGKQFPESSLACLGSWEQGSRVGTPLELS